MSLDTVTRLARKVRSDLSAYCQIDESLLLDYRNSRFSTPFIRFDVEIMTDGKESAKTATEGYREEGVLVFHIFNKMASGDRDHYTIRDLIKDNFRQTRVEPLTGEDGTIYLEDLTQRPLIIEPNPESYRSMARLDVMINFNKCYNE